MKLSFRRFLETGEVPPFVFGVTRAEIFRLFGKPTSWHSKDEFLCPPRRDFWSSDCIAYGSLVLALEADRLTGISIVPDVRRDFDYSFPFEVISFPQRDTTFTEIKDYMRRLEIPFEDVSQGRDGSLLKSTGGVTLLLRPTAEAAGRLFLCSSQAPTPGGPNQARQPTAANGRGGRKT
jgi:hypothetical protein